MNHSWWWHVFHDPMNENPWAFIAGVVIIGGTLALMFAHAEWRSRRIKRRWKQ